MLISELQTSNKATVKDEDGASPDWLELYNTGTATVSLAVGAQAGGGGKHGVAGRCQLACPPAFLAACNAAHA